MGLMEVLPSGYEWGTLLRVCTTLLKASAHYGEKTRSRAQTLGSSAWQGNLKRILFSWQHRGKKNNQMGTSVGGFYHEGQPCKKSWAWREVTMEETSASGIVGEWEDTTGKVSFLVLFPGDLARCVSPSAFQRLQEELRRKAGTPRAMFQFRAGCALHLAFWCP